MPNAEGARAQINVIGQHTKWYQSIGNSTSKGKIAGLYSREKAKGQLFGFVTETGVSKKIKIKTIPAGSDHIAAFTVDGLCSFEPS